MIPAVAHFEANGFEGKEEAFYLVFEVVVFELGGGRGGKK
jgi:hypothetical protein